MSAGPFGDWFPTGRGAFGIEGASWTGTSLELPLGISFDAWTTLVVRLVRAETAIQWAIGDALAYGDREFGEGYTQIAAMLAAAGVRREQHTLENYRWVAKWVDSSRRREDLTWGHHAEVAALKPREQSLLLASAAAGGWGVRRLREEKNRTNRLAAPAVSTRDGERWRLIHSSIATIADTEIAPGTIDAIVCDPPYRREFLGVYTELSVLAARVLRRGGAAFVMTGNDLLPEYLNALTSRLSYCHTIAYVTPGGSAQIFQDPWFLPQWKPVIVLRAGDTASHIGPRFVSDLVTSGPREKDRHQWQQSLSGMLSLVQVAAERDWVILDPFCGSGTTGVAALQHGCRFVGVDVDEAALATAATRLIAEAARGEEATS